MRTKIFKIFFPLWLVLSFVLAMALPARPALADDYTLILQHSGNGSVTSPGEGTFTYASGTVVNLVATPGSGATFLYWDGNYVDGTNYSSSSISVTVVGDSYMKAYFTGSGGGTTTTTTGPYTVTATAGANGSISPSGATSVSDGGSQTYIITANSGYRIADVLVDGSSVGAVTSYTFGDVIASHTISATFTLNTLAITATAGANGSISPSGVANVNFGGSQAYTITPATGYHIAGVLVDGTSVGTSASYLFSNITAAHSISASFAINTYTITATAGANGQVSPPGTATVNYGGSQTYTITPAAGYHVADVLVDGASVGAKTDHTFSNITAAHTIAVTFAVNSYVITPLPGDHGSIVPLTPVTVNHGSSQNFTITPNKGYHVADVLVDGASVGPVASYTFTNVTAARNIAVRFAINTYTITPTAGQHGSISPFTVITVNYGDNQVFTFTPGTAYRVADVKVDGTSVGSVRTYTFSNITADHTVDVTFTYGWPFYVLAVIGVLLVFLLGFLAGRSGGSQ